VFDPRLLLRWEYIGRIAITLSIFFAVGFVFKEATPDDQVIATRGTVRPPPEGLSEGLSKEQTRENILTVGRL
jgi:hypothetical protein